MLRVEALDGERVREPAVELLHSHSEGAHVFAYPLLVNPGGVLHKTY